MRKLVVVLACVLSACVVGEGGQTPVGDDDDPPPPGDPPPDGISGTISSNQTWMGNVAIVGPTIIDTGATVTVMAGTRVTLTPTSNLQIKGALDVQGTKGSEVHFEPVDPAAANPHFGSFNVSGTLTMTYAVQIGGGITVVTGGTATITDTKMSRATGDFLVMNGGTINVQYSEIGEATEDTTHCHLHFGGQGNSITVNRTNIIGRPYGLMFYGGQNANFQNNNWDEITGQADPDWIQPMPGVTGDFSGGYFAGGAPATNLNGSTLTINTPSATRLTDAGVR